VLLNSQLLTLETVADVTGPGLALVLLEMILCDVLGLAKAESLKSFPKEPSMSWSTDPSGLTPSY